MIALIISLILGVNAPQNFHLITKNPYPLNKLRGYEALYHRTLGILNNFFFGLPWYYGSTFERS